MESIYFNESGEYEENHGWDRIYKKSDMIFHETYKYKTIEEIDGIVEEYVLKGYVLDKIKPNKNLVILRKGNSTIYIWSKSKDMEEITLKRLY
tara:strand:- start:86 stop:364 length:279 start_codon:yes stop_codon:yes gene_type:complete